MIQDVFAAVRDFSNKYSIPIKSIFDVGSYIGTFSLEALSHFPKSDIYAFEPFLESFEKLEANTKDRIEIKCFNYALGEEKGESIFYVNKKAFTNSLLPNSDKVDLYVPFGMCDPISSHRVVISSIADFLMEQNLGRIDLLKMDTQGFEYKVLKGAASFLVPELIPFIYTEVSFVDLYKGQIDFDKLKPFLESKGYRLYRFYNKHKDEEGKVKWADALFLPKNYGL